MLAQLAEALGYALITLRRLLKQVGYFRSYTDNGKWYTLGSSPRFDREGLWRHRGIGFSKHGSLTATIEYLVGRSPAGLSARELADKLRHPCHAVLTNLHKSGELDRLKVGGEFRYLSTEEQSNRRQRQGATAGEPLSATTSLSTQAAVLVLVEHVKNPELSFERIAANLSRQEQLRVAPESIRSFFEEHGLKKTPAAPSPGH
jgi:hypothetical protein